MANLDAYLQHLARVPLFNRCDKKQLKAISRRATELRFDPGRQLTRENAPGYEFFVIVSGTAKVMRGDSEVATLGPGDFFGEMALLENAPRTATVTVEEPMEALVIDGREFRSLLREAPELSFKLMAGMAARIRELDDRLF